MGGGKMRTFKIWGSRAFVFESDTFDTGYETRVPEDVEVGEVVQLIAGDGPREGEIVGYWCVLALTDEGIEYEWFEHETDAMSAANAIQYPHLAQQPGEPGDTTPFDPREN